MTTPVEHLIEVGGKRAQYYTEGEGDPILFLPGFLGVWEGTRGRYPTLSAHFQLVGLNWPGVNLSERLDGRHTIESYSRFLLDFVNASNLPIRKVVASSIACLTTLTALSSDPNTFDKLAFFSPTDDYQHLWYGRFLMDASRSLGERRTFKIARSLTENRMLMGTIMKFVMPYTSADNESVSRYQRNARDRIPIEVSYQVLQDVLSKKWTYLFERTRVPTLMIAGQNDRLALQERARKVASLNPNAKLIILMNEDHHIRLENNKQLVDEEILKFFGPS